MSAMQYKELELIRNKKPLIQSITNAVTVNDCANILLAVGASPIMAHNKNEVAEVQKSADGLLLNLGATDDYDAFLLAAYSAAQNGHPIVLDPVGVTISSFRRNFLFSLLSSVKIDCIRCNYAEAISICERKALDTGLDSKLILEDENQKESFINTLKEFSNTYNCIIVASGPEDIICYKDEYAILKTGSTYMKHVTGMGCMCSEVVCAFLSVNNTFDSAVNAIKFYGDCGKDAEELSEDKGTMTFRTNFIDEVSKRGCLWT